MGAYVRRNNKTYYKADDGKLYQDYNSALAAYESRRSADRNPLADFNPAEAVLGAVLNNPTAKVLRGAIRFAGDRLGAGSFVDSADNAIRAVTGDRTPVNPSSYSAQTRNELASAIDRAYARGATPNTEGYVPVEYADYSKSNLSTDPAAMGKYVLGRMFARKTDDGGYEISPDERYDYNAAAAVNREAYKKNLDQAFSDALGRGDLKAGLASAADFLNYYTGIGERGMSVGGTFDRSSAPAEAVVAEETTSASPKRNQYVIKEGDTLSRIAAEKGLSVRDLINMNKISNPDLIIPGQQLLF